MTKLKGVLIVLTVFLTACTHQTHVNFETGIPYSDGSQIRMYDYTSKRSKNLKVSNVIWAAFDFTKSETLIAFDTAPILYIDQEGNRHRFKTTTREVAVKITEDALVVVSQFDTYFEIAMIDKTNLSDDARKTRVIDGTFSHLNYHDHKLLMGSYSDKTQRSKIDMIRTTLHRETLLDIEGTVTMYPVYHDADCFIYAINDRIIGDDRNAIRENTLHLIKKGEAETVFNLALPTLKANIRNGEILILTSENAMRLYHLNRNEKTLKETLHLNVHGLGHYFNGSDEILITNESVIVNGETHLTFNSQYGFRQYH